MKKRVLSLILVCAVLAGIATSGLVVLWPLNTEEANEERQVSDYFYVQIYNADNQVVTRYKITLTGTVSKSKKVISSVSVEHEFGDVCETIQRIDGDMAGVVITHPTEGYLMRVFMLDENGAFLEY